MNYHVTEIDKNFVKLACLLATFNGHYGVAVIEGDKDIIFQDSGNDSIDNMLFKINSLHGKKVYLSTNPGDDYVKKIYMHGAKVVLYSNVNFTQTQLMDLGIPLYKLPKTNISPDIRAYRMAVFIDEDGNTSVEAVDVSNDFEMLPGMVSWVGETSCVNFKGENFISEQNKFMQRRNVIEAVKFREALMENNDGSFIIHAVFSKKSHDVAEKCSNFVKWVDGWREVKL
jgi:hypothetical protein